MPDPRPAFTWLRRIRFGDTDPAGIVFYPRYFEMFVELIEDFFEQALEMPFDRLHLDLGLAIPLAEAQATFLRPSRLGETLTFSLTVHHFGRTSFTTDIAAHRDQEQRLRARLVMVFLSMADARPTEPPPDLAARIKALLVDQPPASPAA